MRIIVEAVS